MKVSFRIFDHVRLDVNFSRREDGTLFIEKAFPHFLGRDADPHLSLFLNDDIWKPHFTAAKNRPNQFRGWLPRISPAAVGETFEHFADETLRGAATTLEPVDFRALEDDGWLVHWADWRAIRRWMRQACRQSREIRVDTSTVATLVHHVLRHVARPTALQAFRPATGADMFAIRRHETREPEVRALNYFSNGFGRLDADREPFETHPPGWYLQPLEIVDEETILRVLPTAKFEKAAGQVEQWLSKYPRSGPSLEAIMAELDELPPYAMRLFGFYAAQILDYELVPIVEAAAEFAKLKQV